MSSMVTVYGIKNCNTMQKAMSWLRDKEVEFTFVDVKKEPLQKEELAVFAHQVGLDTLVNKRGTTWKKLGLAEMELSDAAMLEHLVEHQSMIKRPVVVFENRVMVGFDEDALSHFLDLD